MASNKEPVILTDDDPMPYGQHKGTIMKLVPARDLMWLYDNGKCSPAVRAYIEDNMDVLLHELGYKKR